MKIEHVTKQADLIKVGKAVYRNTDEGLALAGRESLRTGLPLEAVPQPDLITVTLPAPELALLLQVFGCFEELPDRMRGSVPEVYDSLDAVKRGWKALRAHPALTKLYRGEEARRIRVEKGES